MEASLNEKLQAVKWGEYKLGDLFDVDSYTKRFDANKVVIKEKGEYPYIVRTSINNGQKGYIDEDHQYLNKGNTIAFGQDTATMFYQEKPYFTGDKIKVLKPKLGRFNKNNAQFFLVAMRKPFELFSWGTSSYNVEIIKKQRIVLPVKDDKIDFDFMESFVAELEAQRVAELSAYLTVSGYDNYELSVEELDALRNFSDQNDNDWGTYTIGNLFEKVKTKKLPYKAKELPKQPTDDYILPCLTSSFQNQGLNYYAPKSGATILSNVISIPSNSDVYRAYYQTRDFTVLSDAYAIRWKAKEIELSPNQYLFMVMCINKVTDLPIYSYKNKLGGWNVVKNKNIRLPEKDGKIDFALMEAFISAIKKLTIKEVVLYSDRKIAATKEAVSKTE
ncbi:restriction endonuclease subunit S [Faecalibacterium sp. I3-3-33]|uniref:restriction endonuclease subunit S n=1 Tax=Faecalibacterium sp. I3-3-33 TaxID=2929492 RepID=UPI002E7FD760|nr:restriction endonuclease subunit S [Faecalibacterium sp. I3-3-33]